MAGAGRSGLRPASGDMSCGIPYSTANSSGPSVGVSSLVTDANSLFSGGPQLQQSTSINADSYMRLPTSPMSFSSNNISSSSVIDCSSVQQSPHDEQLPRKRTSSVTSQLVVQEPGNAMHFQKKSRISMSQGDIQDQQGTLQVLLNQDLMRIQGCPNPHLQAILQQNRLAQLQRQQQILQAFPQIQQAQMIPQQHQPRPQMLPHVEQSVCTVKGPADAGLCCRRLMQYLYQKRQKPAENSISYWRKLVEEYFAPRARKRWCVSSYYNRGCHSLGVLPQTATDAWHCGICGCKSGKGFETAFEILPRLWQFKFDHGVIEEYLFVDMSRECRLSNGLMVLEYGKAVQESVYENLRVVHEGQLRIIFTPELKIMSWEFCAQCHEEFVSRRLVAPQVNQLLQLGQKCQTVMAETGKTGASYQDMQSSCNMFVTAGRQLAKTLEPQLLNEHGLSKRYVRCLQISEVVNSMKDLIGFSHKHNTGPIECLKNYPGQASANLPTEKMEEAKRFFTATGPPTDQNTLSRLIGIDAEISNHMNNNDIVSTRVHGNSPHGAMALNSYQNLVRGGCLVANQNAAQQEASNAFVGGPSQAQPVQLQSSMFSVNGSSGSFHRPPTMNDYLSHSNNFPTSGMNQHVIQQLLQEAKNNRVVPQQASGITNTNGSLAGGDVDPARMGSASAKSVPQLGNCPSGTTDNTASALPGRSNSFKSINSNPSFGGSSISPRANLTQQIDLPELDPFEQEFLENGLFIEDPVDSGFSWKM